MTAAEPSPEAVPTASPDASSIASLVLESDDLLPKILSFLSISNLTDAKPTSRGWSFRCSAAAHLL